jgi:hypothetical protein
MPRSQDFPTNHILPLIFILFVLYQNYLTLDQFGHATGSDVNLHLRLSEGWRRLECPLFNEEYFNNGYPYPPAFHLTVAFLSTLLFTQPVNIIESLEVILLPLVLLSTFFLVYKRAGLYVASLSLFLISTSPAFLDRASQVIPQAVDLFLFPITVYLFLEKRRLSFIATGAYLVYNHWLYAVFLLFGLLLYSHLDEKDREKRAWFPWIGVLSIPLALVMFAHAPAMLEESAGINEDQEAGVLEEPLFAIKYLGYPLLFLLVVIGVHLGFKRPDPYERLFIYWIIGLLPMTFFFPDRFIGYVAQPLGILGALVLGDLIKGVWKRRILVFSIFAFAVLTVHFFYAALLQTGEIWMPLDTLSPFVIGEISGDFI